ncbi:MAG TPA: antibiotic biosynthesis monooxygenase [Burkholderiales bacterium]|nr:antibiotic biosynthesis monooxygenase [Burkholderiales bacterium]
MKTLWNAVVLLAALLAAGAQSVHAQGEPAQGAAYLVTYIEVAPGESGKALAMLRTVRAASRKADGVVQFEAFQRRERLHHFAIVEAWKDAPSRDANLASAHTKKFRAAIQPLLVAGYDERPHGALDVGPATAVPGAKGATVFVVTHVDFTPPKKDEGIAALRAIADPSRQESGNLRYDILQQSNRPNHLTLVEAWREHKALEAHEAAAHTAKFRDVSTPMSGALFDQRLYRAIE